MMTKGLAQQDWRSAAQWDEARDLIRGLDVELETLRLQAGADVLAFYAACDPFVPNYLRCLASPGADYPEACSHFCVRALSQQSGPPSAFFADATIDPLRSGHNDDERVAALLRQRSDGLFGDFVTRERVVSRGWFLQQDPRTGRELALLTVNFRQATSVEAWERVAPDLGAAFERLAAGTAVIRRKLQERSFELLPAFLHLLEVLDPLRRVDVPGGIPELMHQLLQCAVLPLDRPDLHWCGTVHRLTADGQALELIAQEGDFPIPPRTVHDLAQGEGVISWVALRKQAVRIKDLDQSPFRDISIEYLKGVRSQLAVPILMRGELWGTLSLEATAPDVFRFQEVGYLTRVAGLGALAAVQLEMEQVRQERDLYLDAIYASRNASAPATPLPSFEELMRSSTNPIQLDF